MLTAFLAAVAAALGPVPVEPVERPPATEFLGVNAQFLLDKPPEVWGPHLALLQRSGVRVVRFDAKWELAELRQGGGYDWALYDRVTAALARHRIRWAPLLWKAPAWHADGRAPRGFHPPPERPAAYAAFVRAFAQRYGRGGAFWRENPELPSLPVHHYELWNEPSLPFFWYPEPDPEAYADLYLAGRAALGEVDPRAVAVVGGLDGVEGPDFLAGMVRARPELAGSMDALGWHPYSENAQISLRSIREVRGQLDGLGLMSTPIHVTEIGWTTRGEAPRTTEAGRVAHLREVVRTLVRSDCGVPQVLVHTWVTGRTRPDAREDWFGLVDLGLDVTPMGRAFLALTRRLAQEGGALPPASRAVCDRRPRLTARRDGARCVTASVRRGGDPVPGARVRVASPRAGRSPRVARTLSDGSARICLPAAAAGDDLRVTARRDDLLPSAPVRLAGRRSR